MSQIGSIVSITNRIPNVFIILINARCITRGGGNVLFVGLRMQ